MDLVNIFDYKKAAENKVPKMAFDYIIGGSLDELTLKRNENAFRNILLKQYVLRNVSEISMKTKVLDFNLDYPILLDPVSLHQLSHPRGELETAEAAEIAHTIMVLSSLSSTPLEDVAKASNATKWFQLYWYKDRDLTKSMVERAENSNYKAIVLTIDAPVLGHREKDSYNRFTLPEGVKLRNYASLEQSTFTSSSDPESGLARYVFSQFDNSITWNDLDWLTGLTNLPILLKGVQTKEDAQKSKNYDIKGIIISNHGGRQLDNSLSSIECLPRVKQAVGDNVEILLDSGIRRGSDIFKAIALGAKAVLIGRPYIWGLAVNGKEGIVHVIDILKKEFQETMGLVGCTKIEDIGINCLEENTIPNY